MKRPGDWYPCYSANESEADVKKKAAKALKIPEECVEVLETDGGWLTRERREEINVSR